MNPEFQRNLWLELTPRRMILMVVLLALVFFATAVTTGADHALIGTLPDTAEFLFYAIVVVWGTRNAATAVVGEIRDRTWDTQLLSAIGPGAMTWGKLFGSTIYNWFGGAICLGVLLSDTLAHHGPVQAGIDLVYYLAVGAISQAAALLASLIAVRRRSAHTRLDVFLYQVVGMIAGAAVWSIWSAADPAGSIITHKPASDFIVWWGRSLDSRGFLLASLAVFTGWTLVACYREMRLELKMRNGSLTWLAFVVFIGVYVAGFDAWLNDDKALHALDTVVLRLGLALATYAVLTYLMVILEPKDRVHYRWLGEQLGAGRLGAFWNGLQAWMVAYGAALVVAVALIARLYSQTRIDELALIAAGLGFLTRDVAIFVAMRGRQRRGGDLAAIGILIALYWLAPAIVGGLGLENLLMAFFPKTTAPIWLSPAVAWAEGIATAALAISRVAIRNSPAGRSEPSRA
ncbi:MAG: hypothetical protein JOZ72_00340 [Alphaproteobacteria bacterium]|nr:hypothetical protein [Alphaproteobacteria bacterium]